GKRARAIRPTKCARCATKQIGCNYWYLSDILRLHKDVLPVWTTPAPSSTSVFIAFWARDLSGELETKKRFSCAHWDVMDFQEDEERPRPRVTRTLSPVVPTESGHREFGAAFP
uniref:Zn(2)-C6 fungal-type domain-containing protein n=1 Tax=Macrostomum lignano TaxID=282301 RepID=A0A1I8FI24_9PLAT